MKAFLKQLFILIPHIRSLATDGTIRQQKASFVAHLIISGATNSSVFRSFATDMTIWDQNTPVSAHWIISDYKNSTIFRSLWLDETQNTSFWHVFKGNASHKCSILRCLWLVWRRPCRGVIILIPGTSHKMRNNSQGMWRTYRPEF